MINEQYFRLFSLLGKINKFYDDAAASQPDQEQLLANYLNQLTNGDPDENDLVRALIAGSGQFQTGITNGVAYLQTSALTQARSLLTLPFIRAQLNVTVADAAQVVAALRLQMIADEVTLTTLSGTGLVNFLNTILGDTPEWPTSDGPNYADGTFVVSGVVD